MPTLATLAPAAGPAPGLPQVEPISLVLRAEPFDDAGWIFEPKYDGCRALLYHSDHGCEIETFQDVAGQIQELRGRVADVLRGRETILDGEIVALDRQGKPVLHYLVQGEGYPAFAASDLLWLDGVDLRDQPLEARKGQLAQLLPEDTGPLYKVLTVEEHGRALFGAIKRLDLPGIVAKSRHDPYGPTTAWYEIRNPGRCTPLEGRDAVRQRARLRHLSRDR